MARRNSPTEPVMDGGGNPLSYGPMPKSGNRSLPAVDPSVPKKPVRGGSPAQKASPYRIDFTPGSKSTGRGPSIRISGPKAPKGGKGK